MRFNAVNDVKFSGNKVHLYNRYPSAMIGSHQSVVSGFFENTSYTNAGGLVEAEDDDPLYEILDCHKVTFIECKLKDPLGQYAPCEFAKEDIEDYIRSQFDFKPPAKYEDKFSESVKNKISRAMTPIVKKN